MGRNASETIHQHSHLFYKGGYLKRDEVPGGYDPELEDLLATIYQEVKKRGGHRGLESGKGSGLET